jgi:hypothetical protein
MGVLTFSAWTLARLVSKHDPHWAAFLTVWALIGSVMGMVLNGRRGILLGASVGLIVGAFFVFYDGFLWLYLTLPPYPKYDL